MSAADEVFEARGEIFIPHLGWLCYPASDIVLLHLREGSFEFREQAFLWSFLRPFDTFLDVGAHCGIFARIASNVISEHGKIFALEPNPDVLGFLQANLPAPAVSIRKLAITDSNGKAPLWKGGASETALSSLAYHLPTEDHSLVQTSTLDQFIADEQLEQIALVKLDVEGSEMMALKGARSSLAKKSILALLVEFTEDNIHKSGYSAPELANELISFGYHPYRMGHDKVELTSFHVNQPIVYENIIFTHDIDAVRGRLLDASPENSRRAREILARGLAAEAIENEATRRLALLDLEKRETAMLRWECRKRLDLINQLTEAAPQPKATIFTSLPPRTVRIVRGINYGLVYQHACLASWIAAGFEIRSINPQTEIDELQELGFPVKYVSSESSRPLINEFLKAASIADTDIVAIINADCLMLNFPELIVNAVSSAKQGLVMVERVNVSHESLLPTGQTCLGFDAFFFAKGLAADISVDEYLAVGQPWWDYWLPTEFAVKGIQLLRLQAPLIFHLDHEQGWSQERWLESGKKLLRRLGSQNDAKEVLNVEEFLPASVTERTDLGGFGDWLFDWLRNNAQLLEFEAGSLDSLFAEFLNEVTNFDGMHFATHALADARNEVARLAATVKSVCHLNKEIADLREAHRSAEAYAFHLEREVASLHEAHGECAPHLKKRGLALRHPSGGSRLLARLANALSRLSRLSSGS
jgi:FkbM family methyltransferase